eukprot:2217076-Amphidinium_carterae.1
MGHEIPLAQRLCSDSKESSSIQFHREVDSFNSHQLDDPFSCWVPSSRPIFLPQDVIRSRVWHLSLGVNSEFNHPI